MHETITSRKNARVLHMKKLASSAGYREETGEFFCDGQKLFEDAVNSGFKIKTVMYSAVPPKNIPADAEVYSVTDGVMEVISLMKTPQKLVFSCEMNRSNAAAEISGQAIIIETIQDPGNVGTILRTANALGIDTVIFTGDCADPFSPKVVRASMGAIFRQKLLKMTLAEVSALKKQGYKIIGAALDSTAKQIGEISLEKTIVAIGSEGSGLSPELIAICDQLAIIPMQPGSESLNAAIAAAIIMWEMKK